MAILLKLFYELHFLRIQYIACTAIISEFLNKKSFQAALSIKGEQHFDQSSPLTHSLYKFNHSIKGERLTFRTSKFSRPKITLHPTLYNIYLQASTHPYIIIIPRPNSEPNKTKSSPLQRLPRNYSQPENLETSPVSEAVTARKFTRRYFTRASPENKTRDERFIPLGLENENSEQIIRVTFNLGKSFTVLGIRKRFVTVDGGNECDSRTCRIARSASVFHKISPFIVAGCQ